MWLLRKLLLSSRGSPRRNQPPGRGSGAWWGYLLPLKHLQACPSAGTLWCTPFGTADTIQCVERYPSGFFHRSSGRGSSGAPTWWCRGTDRASPTPPDGCPHRWRSRSSSSVPAPPHRRPLGRQWKWKRPWLCSLKQVERSAWCDPPRLVLQASHSPQMAPHSPQRALQLCRPFRWKYNTMSYVYRCTEAQP